MGGIRKLCLVAAVGLLVGLAVVGPAAARPAWDLYGDAKWVKGGVGPDHWALQLRSTCPTGYPSCLGDGTFTYGGIVFYPTDLTFADLAALNAWYNFYQGDCGGGSPRFTIGIDVNGDGQFTWPTDGHVFVYWGTAPQFFACGSGWQFTGEMIGNADLRFDATQVGGTFYDSYTSVLARVGTKAVMYVLIDVDGGWAMPGGVQNLLVDDFTVNDNVLSKPGWGAAS